MATETRQKGTIYCTKEQFDTLMSTGSVVIGGQTFTYEDGWQYAVIDKDYVDLTTDQGIEGTKTFVDEANNKSIGINGSGFIYQTGNNSYNISLPAGSGTLATTDNVKKYYRHQINMFDAAREIVISGTIISSKDTPYTKADFISMGAMAFCRFINDNLIGGLTRLARGSGGGICLHLSPRGDNALAMYYITGTNSTYEFVYSYTPAIQLDNTWALNSYTPEEI